MKQKFSILSFVRVCKDMPLHMRHFPSDFIGIVAGTYSQKYGGKDIDQYSLWVVKDGKVVNRISWYHEDQLTLCDDQDSMNAEDMIEEYNFRD